MWRIVKRRFPRVVVLDEAGGLAGCFFVAVCRRVACGVTRRALLATLFVDFPAGDLIVGYRCDASVE